MPPAPGISANSGSANTIQFSCTSCGRKLKVPSDSAGKFSKCPCGAKSQVPTPVQLQQEQVDVPLVGIPVEDPLDDLWTDWGEPAAGDPFAAQNFQQSTPTYSGPAYTAPAYTQRSTATPTTTRSRKKNGNTIGLVGFIISIVSIFLCGLLSPISAVLSLIGLFREPRGFAIAGLVLSFLSGMTMFVGFLLIFLPAFSTVMKHAETGMAAAHVNNFYNANDRLPSKAEFEEIVGPSSQSIEYDTWQPGEFRLTHFGVDNMLGTRDDVVKEWVFDDVAGEFVYQQ